MSRRAIVAAMLVLTGAATPAFPGDLAPLPPPPLARSEQLPPPRDAAMRTLSQLMWDPARASLTRRLVEVLDLFAGADLDLMWEPASGEAASGPAAGPGRLVWRLPGALPYDAAVIVAEFEGTLEDGRPERQGTLRHVSGASYRGGWVAGRMEGLGRLRWADGEEYVGGFRDGRFHGEGRLTLRDGGVFTGTFRDGIRHGPGQAMPAASRSYRSAWRDGVEVAGAREMLAGPRGLAHLERVQQSVEGDVTVGVGVSREYPEGTGPGQVMMYDSVNEDGALRVFPEDREFLDVWRGNAPLRYVPFGEDLYKFSTDYQKPASMSFDVENSGVAALHLAGGYLYVAQSLADLDPALRINRDQDCRQPTITSFTFENHGWSQPEQPYVDGGVLTPGGGQVVQPLGGEIGEGWPAAQVDLRDALAGLGVRFDFFDGSEVPCDPADPDWCLSELRRSELLGSIIDAAYIENAALMVDFGGTLNYTWHDATGQAHAKSSAFLVPLKIGNLPGELSSCAEGGAGLEIYPDPFVLQEQGSGYVVPFPMNAEVAPGQIVRWAFQIDAPKSSHHEFQVVLQLADGREVSSRPVRLSYVKPNPPWNY